MSYSVISNNLLLDVNLSNASKILYFTLNSLAEELCHIKISEKELSKKLDVTDRSIRNSIKELYEYGLIAKYRPDIKEVQTYVIIPYEIRRVVEIETEEEMDKLLNEIFIFIDTEVVTKKKDKDNIVKKIEEEKEKEYTARDYCKYFADKCMEVRGTVVNYSNAKTISIMKRITKGKTVEENLRLIDTFIEIYDQKFKRIGYEYPTVASFGASWIYNIVVEFAKNKPIPVIEEKSTGIWF